MHPEIKKGETGECPICGISLEPHIPKHSLPYREESISLRWRFWLASVLTIPLVFIHFFPAGIEPSYISLEFLPFFEWILSTGVVWIAGWPIICNCFKSFLSRQLNMFSLIGLGILIAYFYSLFHLIQLYLYASPFVETYLESIYFEPSAVITTLVLFGQFLESKGFHKTTEELDDLINIKPRLAHLILPGGEERKIAVEDVKKGDLLKVNPGEIVPVDGVIKDGQSWINESEVTGVSLPVFKRPKDKVFGGSLNGNSAFVLQAEKICQDTLLYQIIHSLNVAYGSKAPLQLKTERHVALFIPLVIIISFLTFLGWMFVGNNIGEAIQHAVAVLIIASPRALSLSNPVPNNVAIGVGVKQGILVKNAKGLELLEKVTTLIIDKMGTLTEGKPLLTKVHAEYPFTEQEVLKLGASVEAHSDHPVAQAIVTGAKMKHIHLTPTTNYQNMNGKGVIARIDGSRISVGNVKLMEELRIDPQPLFEQAEKWQKEGLTISFVALEFRAAGLLAVSDPIRFTAERALQQLHKEHLRIVLATGDSKEAAFAVGKRLQIDEIVAEVLPQDKMALVQRLQKQGQFVAMAADNINDAPAISQADVGIAMGMQMDIPATHAAITLLKGDLRGVALARLLSRKTMQNVRQNLFFSYFYNLMAIPLAAGALYSKIGVVFTPILAVILMILSGLVVIGNALRLKRLKLFE